MASTTRLLAVSSAVALLGMHCSSSGEPESDAMLPTFTGPPAAEGSDGLPNAAEEPGGPQSSQADPAEATPLAGGESPPGGSGDSEGNAVDERAPSDGSGPEGAGDGEPSDETPPDEATPDEAAPDEGAPDEPNTPPPASPDAPRSDLPVPPTNDQPRPSGPAGNLQVLDWAGFRAAVSYTFDDSNGSQIASYATLQGLGVPFTFYLQTNKGESNDATWDRALADGHELGNHTQNHLNSGQGDLAADTDAGTRFIENRFDIRVLTMAAPFGASEYVDIARSRFLINRGVGGGEIAPNDATDRFNLPTFTPAAGAPASAFNGRIDSVRQNGTWHTVLLHGFEGYPQEGAYQPVALQQFVQAVNYAKNAGDVWIDTVLEVGAYWIAQRLVTQAAPVNAGGATTWSWALPERFPDGRFVRVTVDGGTLSQGDVVLPWDEHGYYEVALDAGTLSLRP